jgi:phage terminase large subunit-like protein
MVEGESGLLAVARLGEAPRWVPTRNTLHFPSGAKAFLYSAERPEALRGPQHHFAWTDELAKWPRAEATWDNLMLGLRLGTRPRTIVTTTPKPIPLLKRLLVLPHTAKTQGRTHENPHLPGDFKHAVTQLYAGTRLGRQELDGLLLEDLPGALWTREMIEKARTILPGTGRGTMRSMVEGGLSVPRSPLQRTSFGPPPRPGEAMHHPPSFIRTVIGVDPPATAHGDSCGIIVCALSSDGTVWVLADHTVAGERPEGWARRVAAAAEAWDAQLVVAEKNQGGDMVESVLRSADVALPVKPVHARFGKGKRAEPVAVLFARGKARFAGAFPELEDELCALTLGEEGRGASPDRADAMVWAMTELMLGAPPPEPRVRSL